MVCSCVVFAKDEITIDKMIPVYDENSGVIVSEENGVHSVVFNDKDQNVKYNIVLKNNTKRDISLNDIVLPESPEEFFKYKFVGIDEDTVLEPNSTEEVVLSLETSILPSDKYKNSIPNFLFFSTLPLNILVTALLSILKLSLLIANLPSTAETCI